MTVTNPVLPVEVSNANPIATTNVDEPARQFVRYTVDFDVTSVNEQRLVTTVPAGKRLVIENVTWWGYTPIAHQLVFGGIRSPEFGGMKYLLQMNPPHTSASPGEFVIQDGAQSGPVYFDSGEEVWITISKSGGSNAHFAAAFHGYLVTL